MRLATFDFESERERARLLLDVFNSSTLLYLLDRLTIET